MRVLTSQTAQLAIVVRGIDDDFNITEEMAALFPMKGTAIGSVLLNALQSTLRRFNLKLNSLSGVVTDGAPAMVGKDKRLMALIRKKLVCLKMTSLCNITIFYIMKTCVQNACP
jgi:hypothetical protein